MTWEPISFNELDQLIRSACQRMSPQQRDLWERIRIEPNKWALSPYGDLGGGFWVVAQLGQTVVWYNDIEDGFNCSKFIHQGQIEEQWCAQDRLEWALQKLIESTQLMKTTE